MIKAPRNKSIYAIKIIEILLDEPRYFQIIKSIANLEKISN